MTQTATVYVGPPLTASAAPLDEPRIALVAAGIPAVPRAEWFDKNKVPEVGGPLTFDEDGRVYGLIAPADVPHIGFPGRQRYAPKSQRGYGLFHTGQVRCDDGSVVATGRITMMTGHEDDPYADAQTAAAHYDNTGTAVADVIAWDTPQGVMCAGAARPGLTPEQLRMAMASPPSGDWRPITGPNDLEMVGALLVNVPGFPTSRLALAASGEVASLVASAYQYPIVVTTRPHAQEDPMPETTAPEATTAAVETPPAPVFGKDDVVRIPDGATLGMVASVDDGRAIVQVEVPVTDLQDAGQEGRLALSASARERLLDSQLAKALTRIEEMEGRMTSLVASAEEKQRGAQALNVLGNIPE